MTTTSQSAGASPGTRAVVAAGSAYLDAISALAHRWQEGSIADLQGELRRSDDAIDALLAGVSPNASP